MVSQLETVLGFYKPRRHVDHENLGHSTLLAYVSERLSDYRLSIMQDDLFRTVASSYYVRFRGRVSDTENFMCTVSVISAFERLLKGKDPELYNVREERWGVPDFTTVVASRYLRRQVTDVRTRELMDNIKDINDVCAVVMLDRLGCPSSSYDKPEAVFVDAIQRVPYAQKLADKKRSLHEKHKKLLDVRYQLQIRYEILPLSCLEAKFYRTDSLLQSIEKSVVKL